MMKAILKPQLRPLCQLSITSRHVEPSATSVRQFCASHRLADENNKQSFVVSGPSIPFAQRARPLVRRQRTDDSKSNASNPTSTTAPSDAPNTAPNRQKVVDARSLAAAAQPSGQPVKILRSPKLQNIRNRPTAQNAAVRRLKALQVAGSTKKANAQKTRQQRQPRRRVGSREEVDEGEEERAAEIDEVFREITERQTPKPIQYTPQILDTSSLQQTWPSLPIDATGQQNSIFEKLTSLSERYPNGYVPPHELGKRLYDGQNVLFLNEEEREQALEEAKKLSRQRADALSVRKGELLEPDDIAFGSVQTEEKQALIESLVQGKYPAVESEVAGKPPVVGNVIRNLWNNETFRMAGKSSRFMEKFETLLAASRPVKRG